MNVNVEKVGRKQYRRRGTSPNNLTWYFQQLNTESNISHLLYLHLESSKGFPYLSNKLDISVDGMRSSIARQAVRFTADRCSVAGPSRSSPHRVTRCALSSSSSAKIPAVRAGGSRPQIGSSWSTVPTRTYATYTPPSSESAIPDIPASDTYDIVVIGAANAGLALACALCA